MFRPVLFFKYDTFFSDVHKHKVVSMLPTQGIWMQLWFILSLVQYKRGVDYYNCRVCNILLRCKFHRILNTCYEVLSGIAWSYWFNCGKTGCMMFFFYRKKMKIKTSFFGIVHAYKKNLNVYLQININLMWTNLVFEPLFLFII